MIESDPLIPALMRKFANYIFVPLSDAAETIIMKSHHDGTR